MGYASGESGLRAYFAVNGLGLGHIKRCETIAERLIEDGWRVFFSTYLDGYEYASRRGFKTLRATPISYVVDDKGKVDYKGTLMGNGLSMGFRRALRQVAEEIRYIKAIRPDLIVSDSRASTIIAAKLMGLPVILITNQMRVEMTDTLKPKSMVERIILLLIRFSWFILKHLIEYIWTLSDRIVVPDLPPPYTISNNTLGILAYRRRKDIKFIGPLVRRRPGLSHGSMLAGDEPFIYAAVSGPRRERGILASKLMKALPEIPEYRFILTKGEPLRGSPAKRMGNLTVYPWISDEDQLSLLQGCKAVICRAGHGMISKALAYGKPMILVPIPNHKEQMENAVRIKELGLGEIIEQGDLEPSTIRRTIKQLLGSNLRGDLLISRLGDPIEEFLNIIHGTSLRRSETSRLLMRFRHR
ncbi:MAG: glycosyltransferase family protein [Candidatus Bathyarchaeia archaeon]